MKLSESEMLVCMICNFESESSLTSHIARKHKEIGTKRYREMFPNSNMQKSKLSAEERKILGDRHKEWFKNTQNKMSFLEKRSFPSEIKHWTRKGFSEEEAKKIISEQQIKKSLKQNNEKTKLIQSEKSAGNKNPMSLESISKRHKVSIDEARFLTPASGRKGSLHPFFGKHHSDDSKIKIVKNMKHNFSQTSKGEKSLQKEIKNLFPSAVFNKAIDVFNVDIFIPEKSLVVEYFGDFWHCNPVSWNENDYNKRLHTTAGEKWRRDKERIEKLNNMGYDVIVVWESNYKKENSLEKILNA